ncbi:MAG: ATP-binding cassette domain-containing protein, partial [Victivallales bacterium]|nr:ATP-binding cassette domain-containing protein [Victivallales bacterium]
KRAYAHDFIMESNEGYNRPSGERGCLLSGGQKQRIAIARAILKNPPVLILDEATSALDSKTEQQVQNALNELMQSRTVFAIAHRLSTVVNADKIILLDNGCIAEQGTHKELYNLNGKYRQLYDLQLPKQ